MVLAAAATESTSLWTPQVVLPLAAALLALVGVIWSNLYGARKAREAEDLRHENTLKAEDKRHANALLYHQTTRVRELRFEAYVRLLSASRAATRAAGAITGPDWEKPEDWREKYEKREHALDERLSELRLALAEVEIVGSKAAVAAAVQFLSACDDVATVAFLASTSDSAHDALVPHLKKVRTRGRELRDLIRLETGIDDPIPLGDEPPEPSQAR